eukprot:XP_015581447.1 receptor-like protein EIX1 [Ricinus communis]
MEFVRINSTKATWLNAINMIPSLLELHLPQCELQNILDTLPWLSNLTSLTKLDLSSNSFSGSIPSEFGNLVALEDLDLTSNNIGGHFPRSLELKNLKLAANKLTRGIYEFQNLHLSDNRLNGTIPSSICKLVNLQVLSIRNNDLHGKSLNVGKLYNLCGLWMYQTTVYHEASLAHSKQQSSVLSCLSVPVDLLQELLTKGREYEFNHDIELLNATDLSENNLKGEILDELTSLKALRVLNLSRNHLSGSIPKKIENLKMLETFDLSSNNLSRIVPQSLSSLTFLSHLD